MLKANKAKYKSSLMGCEACPWITRRAGFAYKDGYEVTDCEKGWKIILESYMAKV